MIGVALLVLGLIGWITRLARIVPQSVLAGLQAGLGLALALVSFNLMATAPVIAMVTLGLLLGFLLAPRYPSAVIALMTAIVLAQVLDVPGMQFGTMAPVAFSIPSLPSLAEMQRAFSLFALPQLSLTLTNAVVLTALIAGDYFGERAAYVTPARLSITSGLANLLLTPLGALPMCHGAGGWRRTIVSAPAAARPLWRWAGPCSPSLCCRVGSGWRRSPPYRRRGWGRSC
jgi:predicted benzoate:H+ symporter BenE